jgi:hypothetical protein
MTRIVLVLAAAMATTSVSFAAAQTVGSFEQLGLVVNRGDRLTVIDSAGQELRGKVVDLSPSALSLQIDGFRRYLEQHEVSVVHRRQRDSLRDGALLGFMSGAAIAASSMRGAHPHASMAGMAVYGALGALVGIGFDALREDSQVVYRANRPARRLTVSPLLSRDRRGLALSVGF